MRKLSSWVSSVKHQSRKLSKMLMVLDGDGVDWAVPRDKRTIWVEAQAVCYSIRPLKLPSNAVYPYLRITRGTR